MRLIVKLISIVGIIFIIYLVSPEILVVKKNNSFLQHIDIFHFSNASDILEPVIIKSNLKNHFSCSKKLKNLVFVKTHKTGTSTTVNVLYHFGIVNELDYAIYPYTHQLHSINSAR